MKSWGAQSLGQRSAAYQRPPDTTCTLANPACRSRHDATWARRLVWHVTAVSAARVQFTQAVAQVVERDVHHVIRAGKRQPLHLGWRAHVEDLHAAEIRIRIQEVGDSVQLIAGREGRHVDGILGRAEGGRVGQVQAGQIPDRRTQTHGGGDHVDPFVDTVLSHGLGPQHAAILRIEDQLERDGRGAGIVAGVIVGHHGHAARGNTQLPGSRRGQAGLGGRHFEHPDDRRAEDVGHRMGRIGRRVLARQASRPIGRTCQRHAHEALRSGRTNTGPRPPRHTRPDRPSACSDSW